MTGKRSVGRRDFHFLYRSSAAVVRTPDERRLMRGLLAHLATFVPDADDGLLRVDALALISERGALIVPAPLRQWLPTLDSRLRRRNMRFVDMPYLLFDPERAEVVVPRVGLDVDWSAVDEFDALTPGPTDEPVEIGRYPINRWAFLGEGDDPSRAQAVAVGTRLTFDFGKRSVAETVEALARAMQTIEPRSLHWDVPAKLVSPLAAMA